MRDGCTCDVSPPAVSAAVEDPTSVRLPVGHCEDSHWAGFRRERPERPFDRERTEKVKQ
jgi:hypothetical protein